MGNSIDYVSSLHAPRSIRTLRRLNGLEISSNAQYGRVPRDHLKAGARGSWGLGGILRLGVSPDGRRYISIRIPGTGISWVKYYGRAISSHVAASGAATPAPPVSSPSQTASPQNPTQPAPTGQ